jgi:transcriptional regulator with XRE-family HTH domain
MATTTRENVTNAEFALRIGCHHTTASRYRSGERIPSAVTLLRIIREFDITDDAQRDLEKALAHPLDLEHRRAAIGSWLRRWVFEPRGRIHAA